MIVYPCFKDKTYRSEEYMDFIRSQPCLICGKPSVCHHEPLNGRGTSSKGPDNESLPLCDKHHTTGIPNRHMTGRKTFYEYYGIDWREQVVKYQLMFDKQKES